MANEGSSNPSSTDSGWKYCTRGQGNSCVCNFCGKVTKGGITRAKEHLMAKPGNVAAYAKCPKEVREELWGYLKDTKKQESETFQRMRQHFLEDYGDSDEERALDEGFANIKKEKLRQESIRQSCDKEATARVHQYIARFWYQAGLSFNLVKLQSFHKMLTNVGAFGPNLRPPSYHEIRVPLLAKELENTEILLKDQKELWGRFGCSIMSDVWTDRKQRSIINFLVNCTAGTMFYKSIDPSNFVKSGEKTFELLDSIVEEIGEEKVVQVITGNGSNYVLAGKFLERKRSHLYWIPCAAHCIDLMLEDIGKLPLIKKTILRAISLVGFIYSHSSTLSLLRCRILLTVRKKPAMGYIYEAMEKAKEAIRKSFEYNESKGETKDSYRATIYKMGGGMFGAKFAIQQRSIVSPAQWWLSYGLSTPNLQHLAIKILILTCSASGCECNWSFFELFLRNRQPMTYTRQKTKKKKEPESLGVEDATPKTKRGQVRGSSSLRGKEQMIKVEDNAVSEESEELQGIDFGDSEEVSF
ncbi:putative RING-type E3 ubiquitin transferase C3H69 isoform B [Glycine soja]|uniref:Putative RING-type E3 ubiquitin transferase C3H69 isoform B n=1 Tax=Glycine soja TaxID=3848 RepID=A0A445JF33_GLYSO|nr:putative RING-type E3 ubiquitin transferase C3H69 isoform B [Glycine soja]